MRLQSQVSRLVPRAMRSTFGDVMKSARTIPPLEHLATRSEVDEEVVMVHDAPLSMLDPEDAPLDDQFTLLGARDVQEMPQEALQALVPGPHVEAVELAPALLPQGAEPGAGRLTLPQGPAMGRIEEMPQLLLQRLLLRRRGRSGGGRGPEEEDDREKDGSGHARKTRDLAPRFPQTSREGLSDCSCESGRGP